MVNTQWKQTTKVLQQTISIIHCKQNFPLRIKLFIIAAGILFVEWNIVKSAAPLHVLYNMHEILFRPLKIIQSNFTKYYATNIKQREIL